MSDLEWGPETATERLGAYVFPVDHPELPTCAGVRTPAHDPDTCKERGKHPCVKFTVASVGSAREAVALFAGTTRNYGINCARSRLIVLDEDVPGVVAGYVADKGVTVPPTFTVRTGRQGGGRHHYFRLPSGHRFPKGSWRLPKGIDVKVGQAYVVGPGSLHASGQRYEAENDLQPADVPQWVLDAFEPAPEPADAGEAAAPEELPADLADLLAQPAGQGERSERFHHLVGLCRRSGLSQAQAVAVLTPWCKRVGKFADRVAVEVGRSWGKVDAPRESASHASQDSGSSHDDEKESAATILVKLALARFTFGVSAGGETFAIPKQGPHVVQMLRGGRTSLRSQLSKMFFGVKRKAAPQQALADALLMLQGEAEEQDEAILYQRVARHDGAVWLDLGDPAGRAVRITAAGWTVEPAAPVLFRRTVLNAALPTPVGGGDLDELWSWLNVTKEDRPLLAAWLVAALHDAIPHPVLGLFGEQGTGKTTAEKVLVSILDPSPVPTRKPPKDADSWVTAAQGSWVVGLDNLTDIPDWLSDSMCRAVTGDGDVRRQLYADNALVVFAFRRCLAVTGIDLGALNGDLADRMLTINLEVIEDDDRRDEAEIWPRWAAAHPRILGAVLDLAASVEALLPSVRLARKPRMADFAKILYAVDQVLETEGLPRFVAAQSQMARDALTADAFVVAMAEKILGPEEGTLTGNGGTFTGTSKQLLALVTPTDEKWRAPKEWPKTPRTVTTKLHKQAPVMRKSGWTVTDDAGGNHGNVVRWTIAPPQPPQPEMAQETDSRDSQTRSTASEQAKPDESGASQPRATRVNGEARESTNSRADSPDSRSDSRPESPLTSDNNPDRESASRASHESGPSQADPRAFPADLICDSPSCPPNVEPEEQPTCCGTFGRPAGGPLAAACSMCSKSPTFWKKSA
jgi:hypothetical protein